jgi:hypothetical protein
MSDYTECTCVDEVGDARGLCPTHFPLLTELMATPSVFSPSECRPTTDDVRYAYCYWMNGDCYTDEYVPNFDRWYAEEKAKWEKEVLNKAAERAHRWWFCGEGSAGTIPNEGLADDLADAVRGEGAE